MARAVLTDHARQRAAEMGIGTKAIKRMLASGDYTMFADVVHCQGRFHARGRDFTAVVQPSPDDTWTVVTILWNHLTSRV